MDIDIDQMDMSNPMGMLSHFTLSSLLAAFIFGVIGLYVFRHAKKTLNYPLIFTSIALMSYPMFTTGWIQDWGIGLGLCALAYSLNLP